jgi:protein-disulfide isomerase
MQNSKYTLIAAIVVGVVFIVGMFLISASNKDPISLPIRVEEYSDFQCPACKYYAEGATALRSEEYEGKVDFVFKHFPLTSIHDRAYPAAVAAEAAREQGKFYEYHDVLFENQPRFNDEDLLKYAQDLGLDISEFEEDFRNNPDVMARVDKDIQEAQDLGLNSTPSFLVNGRKISVRNIDDLKNTIDKYIERAEK